MINEYAEIINGTVQQVIVKDGLEADAIQWLKDNVSNNEWVKATVEDVQGKSRAVRGGEYNSKLKHFVRKKPYNSWVFDEERLMYIPPIPKPIAVVVGYVWEWSQKTGEWISEKIKKV